MKQITKTGKAIITMSLWLFFSVLECGSVKFYNLYTKRFNDKIHIENRIIQMLK